VQQTIIGRFPRADIAVGFVWVNMLPLDNRVTAGFRALTMQAPCVRHFHDPGKQAGRIIAQSLGAQGKVAWDIYLFYPQGVEWADSPPPPAIWAHQLSPSSWADPARYRLGDDLREELTKAMNQLTGPFGRAS
jgi:hypothetical protein